MGIVRWVKHHPWEAAALAAAAVATGGMALAPEAAVAAGAVGGEAALGAGAVAGDAFLPAALGAGGAGGLTAAEIAAGGGEAVSGLAAGQLAGAGGEAVSGPAASHLLAALPEGGAYGMNALADPYLMASSAPGQFAGQGAEASLFDTSQLANPQTAMGPRESTWLSRMGPEKVMRLGMMAAQLGSRPQGGPAPMSGPPQMRQANMTQEDITKKWLMQNDPNTYRRIYGNPQGVA